MSESPPPVDEFEERMEWIIDRAKTLDVIFESDWIADEVEKIVNDPDGFGGIYDPPEEADDPIYALFITGVLFGTDVEFYFPRAEGHPRERLSQMESVMEEFRNSDASRVVYCTECDRWKIGRDELACDFSNDELDADHTDSHVVEHQEATSFSGYLMALKQLVQHKD